MPTLIEELEYAALCCQPGEERRALVDRAVSHIKLLERRARMAKLFITDDKPETAKAALDGTYDNDR